MHSSNPRKTRFALAVDSKIEASSFYILFSVLLVMAAAIATAIRVMPL